MKRCLLLISYFLLSCTIIFAAETIVTPNDISPIIDEIQSILSTSADPALKETVQLVINKIKSESVYFVSDDSIDKNIYSGIGFRASDNPNIKPYFFFYPELFGLYSTNPTIVCSAMIHEFKHCYDYYTNNRLFVISFMNILEKYLFEMDAYHVEALFIREMIKLNKGKITDYENFLVNSFTQDNLEGFSLLFKHVNHRQLYGYINFANANTLEKTIEFYTTEAENIMKQCIVSADDNDWIKFQKLVILKTYSVYVPQLLFDVTGNKTNTILDNETFNFAERYPEIYNLIIQMKAEYNSYTEFMREAQARNTSRYKL